MKEVYESMIGILSGEGFGSVDGWFSNDEISALRKSLLSRYNDDVFRLAGIGNQHQFQKEKTIRNDRISWLNKDLASPGELIFFSKLDAFIMYLNRECYAGVQSYEFHFAVYEPGSFYKRHNDQFNSDDRRKYSMVMYLSDSWEPGDGGELVIYSDREHIIHPVPGRIVLFCSDIEHEVLRTNKQRMSLTGWMKTL